MANLDATTWNDLQTTEGVAEDRRYPLGLVNGVKRATQGIGSYLLPSTIQALQTMSGARGQSIPVIKDGVPTVRMSASFDVPPNLLESDNYGFVAVDIFSGFRIYPTMFENNQIDKENYQRTIMDRVAYEMAKTKESVLAAKLEELKTQVLDYTAQSSQNTGTYSFTGSDVLEIDKAAQKDAMYFHLNSLMEANDLGGNYNLVTSPNGIIASDVEAAKFGANNSENIQWNQTLLPMDRRHYSKEISVGSDVFNGWFFRDGAIGTVSNFPADFRGETVVGEKRWSVSDMELRYLRSRCNIYTNREATEATSIVKGGSPVDTNLVMSHFEEMAIWDRFYIVYPYNSDRATRPSDVVKVKGLTS